jgi:hypothetical protein
MPAQSKDMAKQLELYADTIVAFATAQFLAFTYLIAQGGNFARNVLSYVWIPMSISALAYSAYLLLVFLCHRGQDDIFTATESRERILKSIVSNIRKARYIILVVDCAMTIGVMAIIKLGACYGHFQFDGKR